MCRLYFSFLFQLAIAGFTDSKLDKRFKVSYNPWQYYQKEEEYASWTLATVAPNLTETPILLCSNTDVETQPVQVFSCLGCVFCCFKEY
jgi:hypothetical protein